MQYMKKIEKPLPYNTGKVLIGKHYTPPQRTSLVSEDMEDLQAALLGERRVLRESVVTWLCVVLTIFVVCMDLFIWRPN
jgi:hypothetical protein